MIKLNMKAAESKFYYYTTHALIKSLRLQGSFFYMLGDLSNYNKNLFI